MCLSAQHSSSSACVIVPFPSRLSQFIAQDRPLYIPVCGTGVQSGELLQAPLCSGYKNRAFLSVGMIALLSSWHSSNGYCLLLSAALKDGNCCLTLEWWFNSPLHCSDGHLIAGRNNPASQLQLKPSCREADGERNTLGLTGSSGISKSRGYHIFAQHDACCDCLFTPHAKQLFRSKQIHTPQWGLGLAPAFLQEGANSYGSVSRACPRQLSPQYHSNA